MRYLALLALLFLAGCQTRFEPTSFSYCNNLASGVQDWQTECDQYFKAHCLIVSCHGDSDSGYWVCWPDGAKVGVPVEWLAKTLRKLTDPRRPIVLIICNAGHMDLHVKGVWYAKDAVWSRPCADVHVEPDGNTQICVGTIREFVEGSD